MGLCVVLLLVVLAGACTNPGGPLKQSTLDNYLLSLINSAVPVQIPDIKLDIGNFELRVTENTLQKVSFSTATLSLPKANTVSFLASGISAMFSLNFNLINNSSNVNGSASLALQDSSVTVTTLIGVKSFQNVDASFKVGDLVFSASNQPVIQPYWDFLKPLLIDTLQNEVPFLIKEFNTNQLKSLIFPIVQSLEPIPVPPVNESLLGTFGGFSNMTIHEITFDSATMELGSADNEVAFALNGLSALITNSWEFKSFLTGDKTGTGHIQISNATATVYIGIGTTSDGDFTINLDNSDLEIGDVEVVIDGSGVDKTILNWLIKQLTPLVVQTIKVTSGVVLCVLFGGIPN